jgi:hypothetical protein
MESIPAALGTLRGALLPPGVDPAKLARAAVVVVVVIALSLLVVRLQLARLDEEEAA